MQISDLSICMYQRLLNSISYSTGHWNAFSFPILFSLLALKGASTVTVFTLPHISRYCARKLWQMTKFKRDFDPTNHKQPPFYNPRGSQSTQLKSLWSCKWNTLHYTKKNSIRWVRIEFTIDIFTTFFILCTC